MRLSVAVTLVALLCAPGALAGSEDEPEIVSPRDKTNPAGDLLAVWFEHDPRGLKISFRSASLPPRAASLVYYASFDLNGERHAPGIGFDSQGRLRTDSGANPSGWGSGRLDDEPLVLAAERGSPATLSLLVPWGLYGLEEGDVVEPVMAASSICCDPRGGDWYAPYDTASSRVGSFAVVARPGSLSNLTGGLLPILVPFWVIPTIVVGCTAGGLWAGFAMARASAAKRAAAAAPASVSVPVRPAPRPPGERFQHAPNAGKR